MHYAGIDARKNYLTIAIVDNQGEALANPQEFALEAARILRRTLQRQAVVGIQYEPSGERFEASRFLPEIERLRDRPHGGGALGPRSGAGGLGRGL